MKKLFSIIIAIILIFSMSIPTFAADEYYYVNGKWKFNDVISLPSFSYYLINFDVSDSSSCVGFQTTRSGLFYDYDGHSSVSYDSDFGEWRKAALQTVDFGDTPVSVAAFFYDWLSSNAVPLDEQIIPDVSDNTTTETVYIKEDRPFFTTPLEDFTVTEGLLLLLFVTTFLNNIFKQYVKGN